MNIIYYIIIGDVILIFIGLLIARAINRFHKNVDETVKFIQSMGKDLEVIAKDLEEMNKMLEEKNEMMDIMISKAKEKEIV